mgnify:CR=1 FL=1
MSGFGAIKDGTELEDYDTKYSFFKALGYTSVGITTGTLLVGGLSYAGYKYLKMKKPTKKSKKEK